MYSRGQLSISPFTICQHIMNDKVTDYFQASKELAAKLSEVHKLRQHAILGDDLRLLDVQIQLASERVDELVEIFTWETQETDLIRSAFLEIAKNTLKNLPKLQELHADELPSTVAHNQGSALIENVNMALRKALSSKGRYVPRVEVPQGLAAWCYQVVESYLNTLFRQLRSATFDNLLEAVTYFEKSTLLLRMQYQAQEQTNKPSNKYPLI